MPPYNVGDKVELKSGSPALTVIDTGTGPDGQLITVVNHKLDGTEQTFTWPAAMVKPFVEGDH